MSVLVGNSEDRGFLVSRLLIVFDNAMGNVVSHDLMKLVSCLDCEE